MDNNTPENCQVTPAPVVLDFFKILDFLNDVFATYELETYEQRLFIAFISRLTRAGRYLNIDQERYNGRAYYYEAIKCTNIHYVSRVFGKLEAKKVFLGSVRQKGKTFRALTPEFIAWAKLRHNTVMPSTPQPSHEEDKENDVIHYSEFCGPVYQERHVDNVDNLDDIIHSSEFTEFTPVNSHNSLECISPIHSSEFGSIIEEVSPNEVSPNELPPVEVSSMPKSGDNSEPVELRLMGLPPDTQNVMDEFLAKLAKRNVDEDKINSFLSQLKTTDLDAKALNAAYMRFTVEYEDSLREQAKRPAETDLDIDQEMSKPALQADEVPLVKRLEKFAEEQSIAASFSETTASLGHDDILPLFVAHLELSEAPRLCFDELIGVWKEWRNEKREEIYAFQMQSMSQSRAIDASYSQC